MNIATSLAGKGVTPRAVAALSKLLAGPVDAAKERALFRINALAFAAANGLGEQETVDAFLHATKAGFFTLQWDLMCPMCGASVRSHDDMKQLSSRFHCGICAVDAEASMDDYVQVGFTVTPAAQPIRFHHPEKLSIEDYTFHYHFTTRGRFASGRTGEEVFMPLTRHLAFVTAGARLELQLKVENDRLRLFDVVSEAAVDLPQANLTQKLQLIYEPGGIMRLERDEASGAHRRGDQVSLAVHNADATRRGLMALDVGDVDEDGEMQFPPILTGKWLLASQTFRDLFKAETLAATEGIAIKDVTLLFTDLKGSTALYERMGDVRAFAMVRLHFEELKEAVRRHGGAVVKTIGDAVMATFQAPADALAAAMDMLKSMGDLGADAPLKIGIHRGAAIVVTLNERLDYFGQTVNVAARIQGLADGNEVYVSEEVWAEGKVREVAAGFAVEARKERLKGIKGEFGVRRLVPHLG
jgi:class 3 adenylate cyclase